MIRFRLLLRFRCSRSCGNCLDLQSLLLASVTHRAFILLLAFHFQVVLTLLNEYRLSS